MAAVTSCENALLMFLYVARYFSMGFPLSSPIFLTGGGRLNTGKVKITRKLLQCLGSHFVGWKTLRLFLFSLQSDWPLTSLRKIWLDPQVTLKKLKMQNSKLGEGGGESSALYYAAEVYLLSYNIYLFKINKPCSQDSILLFRDGREPWERRTVLTRLGPGHGFHSVKFVLWVDVPIMMSFRAHPDKHHNFSIENFAISSKNSFFIKCRSIWLFYLLKWKSSQKKWTLKACIFCSLIADHVMLAQRTASFKCRHIHVDTCIRFNMYYIIYEKTKGNTQESITWS